MGENKIMLVGVLIVMLLGIGYALVNNILILGMLQVREGIRYLLDSETSVIYKTDISDYGNISLSVVNEGMIIFMTNIVGDDAISVYLYINPNFNKHVYIEPITTICVRAKSLVKG